ncbi:MAG TPA: cytidine deaminase [Actinomycetota bacterium]|jgi:cytidine deaminase|nr:cytidine deaminase [Actinomycetota bacterium]
MNDEAAIEELLEAARGARDRAYAPYSHFPVGAAVASDAGVFSGANVENAASPTGVCAERVAAASAVAAGGRRIEAVAVVSEADEPITPCGQCRQFLSEFGPGMLVVSEGTDETRRRWTLSDLLPEAFGPKDVEPSGR